MSADVTDKSAAHRILAEVRPHVLVLNAGAVPVMGPLDQLSWADFTAAWETDVKAGLYWLQAELNLPLRPGSRVLVGSRGAGEAGSPLSGGYAGAASVCFDSWRSTRTGSQSRKDWTSVFKRSCRCKSSAGRELATKLPAPTHGRWDFEREALPFFPLWKRAVCHPADLVTRWSLYWTIRCMPAGLAFGLKGDTGIHNP